MADVRRGTMPWDQIGADLGGTTSAEEAVSRAGLGWCVGTAPVFGPEGMPIPGYRCVIREDTHSCLGIVGRTWSPIQNGDLAALGESIARTSGAKFVSGGAARGGRLAWLLLGLPGTISVAGDEVEPYLLLSNSHNASRALRGCVTPIRVRCSNALRVAESRGSGMISIRHTRSAPAQMEEALRVLECAVEEVSLFKRTAESLASRSMTKEEVRAFTEALFPLEGDGEAARERVLAVRASVAAKVDGLGIGLDIPGIRGTRWAALNSVAEVVDHDRRYRSAEGRFRAILLDDGAVLKRKALNLLLSN